MLEADADRSVGMSDVMEREDEERDAMIAIRGHDVVIVPGLHGSGPAHWQSRWEKRHVGFRRAVQDDWNVPDLDAWSGRVETEIGKSASRVLIVAHSFGCLASVHGTCKLNANVAGALFVAPADPGKFGLTARLLERELPYPSILIASSNDPWMRIEHAAFWACQWGSAFVDAGDLGHINADSNLGDWDFGWRYLGKLARLAALRAGWFQPASDTMDTSLGAPC